MLGYVLKIDILREAFKKKIVTFFTSGGGGGVRTGLRYTFFFKHGLKWLNIAF